MKCAVLRLNFHGRSIAISSERHRFRVNVNSERNHLKLIGYHILFFSYSIFHLPFYIYCRYFHCRYPQNSWNLFNLLLLPCSDIICRKILLLCQLYKIKINYCIVISWRLMRESNNDIAFFEILWWGNSHIKFSMNYKSKI